MENQADKVSVLVGKLLVVLFNKEDNIGKLCVWNLQDFIVILVLKELLSELTRTCSRFNQNQIDKALNLIQGPDVDYRDFAALVEVFWGAAVKDAVCLLIEVAYVLKSLLRRNYRKETLLQIEESVKSALAIVKR